MVERFFISLVISILVVHGLAFGVSVQELQEGSLSVVRIENSKFVAKIAANSGGRIYSLKSKSDDLEQVWWKDSEHGGLANCGLLNDKQSNANYSYTIEDNGPKSVIVVFKAPTSENELGITKKISVIEGEPAIRVEYIYSNPTNEVMTTRHMVKNCYLAGGKAGAEDFYYWRGLRGIESKAYPYGDIGKWHKVEKPWYAVIDSKSKKGMVWVIDSLALDTFYNWADRQPDNPSVEWMVKIKALPGKQVSVPVVMGILEGLAGVTDASEKGVIYVQPEDSENKTLSWDGYYYPLEALAGDRVVSLRCDYETLGRVFLWGEDSIQFDAANPGQLVSGHTEFSVPKPGTHVLMVKAKNSGNILNDFEIPVVIGKSTGTYYNGRREEANVLPLATVTDRDVADGYALHWGGFEAPFSPAKSLEFVMGTDEYESLELGVLALNDMGTVEIKVDSDGKLSAESLVIRTSDGVSNSGVRLSMQEYGLCKGDMLVMQRGDYKSFWLTFRSHKLMPGDYPLEIKVSGESINPRAINAILHVVDAKRAPRSEAALRAYNNDSIYGNLKKHSELMLSHYIDEIQVCVGFRRWHNTISVSRDADGKLKYDLSVFNSRMKDIRDLGFRTVGLMYTFERDVWFASLGEQTAEEKENTRIEIGRRMVENILALGFEDVWLYAIDEPAIAYATKPETVERCRRFKSLHPLGKVHTTVNHYGHSLFEALNPVMDVWTMGLGACETMCNDIRHGKVAVDKSDEVGFYTGAFYNTSPDQLRSLGWQAAFLGIKYYSVFAYSETKTAHPDWKLWVKGLGGPVTTAAFEGLRDGFEDYGYWQKLARLLRQAKDIDRSSLSEEQRNVLSKAFDFKKEVFGTDDTSLVPMRLKSGGHGYGPWHKIKVCNRWKFLELKGTLLRHIAAVQDILGEN